MQLYRPVPSTHSSGDKELVGGITRRGHTVLRSAIIESAWIAARHDPALIKSYHEYCRRMDPNKAINYSIESDREGNDLLFQLSAPAIQLRINRALIKDRGVAKASADFLPLNGEKNHSRINTGCNTLSVVRNKRYPGMVFTAGLVGDF
jgi:hypothetical protein